MIYHYSDMIVIVCMYYFVKWNVWEENEVRIGINGEDRVIGHNWIMIDNYAALVISIQFHIHDNFLIPFYYLVVLHHSQLIIIIMISSTSFIS